MNSFFTKILEGLLKFTAVCIAIFALFVGFQLAEDSPGWGFLAFCIIIVSGLISISFLGAFVELCLNVIKIGETNHMLYESMNKPSATLMRESGGNTTPRFFKSSSAFGGYKSSPPISVYSWTCEFCGTGNLKEALTCSYCGEKRKELKEIPKGKWRCDDCFTLNVDADKKCFYCGSVRKYENYLKNASGTTIISENKKLNEIVSIETDNETESKNAPNEETNNNVIYCPICGEQNEGDNSFCMYCGATLIHF